MDPPSNFCCRSSAIWSEATGTGSATCFASEAARSVADRATVVVRGRNPLGGSGAKPSVVVRGAKPPGKFSGFYVNFRPGEHL